MYFLTVKSNDEILLEREPFTDYAEAVAACGKYYEPRFAGSVLSFTTDVSGKQFLRSYAQLTCIDDLGEDVPRDSPRWIAAAKQSNAFTFAKSYVLLIESEEAIREAERMAREDDED